MFLASSKLVLAVANPFTWYDNLQISIANTIIQAASKILWLGGATFNYAMEYTINFSKVVEQTGVVAVGWTIFRDISNMVFIFILLIISISIILGSPNYGSKKLLTKVILVALLINFSLFASKVIIDSANVFTVGFYNAITSKAPKGGEWDQGISSMFARSLNLHTIYQTKDMEKGTIDEFGATLNPKNIWTICLFGSIFLVITAFVFFAASILFMKRLIVLMILMMISPLAFLGMILPATSGFSKQWWKTLFQEAFYAPFYLMFTYVVLMGINSPLFRQSIGRTDGSGSFTSVITGNAGGGMSFVIFNFILIIGLMLASIISASKIGANGASGMISMGKGLQKWGQGRVGAGTFGMGGRLGRNTVGRGFNKMAESGWMQDWAAKGGAGSRLALKTLKTVGDSSFDARNTGAGKTLGLGEGIKGGYKTKTDETKKARIAYAKSLKKGDSNVQARDASGALITNPTTGAPVMLSRAEAYGKEIGNRKGISSIMGIIAGTAAADKKAGEALVNEYKYKKELKDAKKKLKRLNDELDDLRKPGVGGVGTFGTAVDITNKRNEISDADNEVEDLQEKIKKLKEDK